MMRSAESEIIDISAFILAAGRGSRLYPYSKTVSKPLLPILNKPLIIHSIERLLEAGIENIGVVIKEEEQQIPYLLQKNYPKRKFQYIIQKEPLGTGHAVLQIENRVRTENFIVVAGDSLFSIDFLRNICLDHLNNQNSATLSLEKMSFEKMQLCSTVDYHNGRVWEIREKPQSESEILSNLNSAACYVFSTAIFNSLKYIDKSQRNEYELASAINHLIKEKMIVGGNIATKVHHVSNSYDLWKLNIDFLDKTKSKDADGNLIDEDVKINPSAIILKTIVGEKSKIGKNVKLEKTVILPNSMVNNSYKNSLVLSEHAETFMEN
jgi:glucose-1-phosphate thymidylyltransferase